MGMFKNLSQTKVFSSNYFKYGSYVVRIDRVKSGENYKHVRNIVVETTVLAALQSSEPGPYHVAGDEAAQVMTGERAQGDFAQFASAVLDCRVEELDSPEIKQATGGKDLDDWLCNEDPRLGDVQPWKGLVVAVEVRMKMTKEKPGKPSHPVTNHVWKGQVSKEEVLKLLTPEQVAKFFPGNSLR